MERESRFIVVPMGSFTYHEFGEYLNAFYRTVGEEVHFLIGTVPKDGFYVPHGVITKIKKQFADWKDRFEFYSQKGGGPVGKYSIPNRKKTVKEKKVIADLKEMRAKKQKR